MDVDRLRLGSVPLAPDTVLWFEFLLDSTLLAKHLSKPNPDPKPMELMIKFLTVDDKEEKLGLEDESEEIKVEMRSEIKGDIAQGPKFTKRSLAIKILAVKVLAFLNWDLTKVDSMLPLMLQVSLLDAILYISTEDEFSIQTYSSIDFSQWDKQAVFAITYYHRWVLKAFMTVSLISKQTKFLCKQIPGLREPNQGSMKKEEDFQLQLEKEVVVSEEFLNQILDKITTVTVPTMDSVVQLTEESSDMKVKWTDGIEISADEFKCQVHYELGCFSYFKEDYTMAKFHFGECLKLYQKKDQFQTQIQFCILLKSKLDGYCKALGIKDGTTAKEESLLEKFRISVKNQYTGIMQILQTDNVRREIPLVDRSLLEVDIQVAMSSGTATVAKDTLLKIQILNTIRRVLTNEIMVVNFAQTLRNAGDKGMEFFLTTLNSLMAEVSEKDLENLKYFLLDIMMGDVNCSDRSSTTLASMLLSEKTIRGLFTDEEMAEINLKIGMSEEFEGFSLSYSNNLPTELITRNPRLEIMNIQQQLIQSYDTANIKKLLHKLCAKDSNKSWWRLNNKWDLPIPLQSVVMTISKGFIQDLIYILLAKSRELSNNKDFRRSILLLENTVKEAKESTIINRNTCYKLNRLIDWEILLVQISQYLEEYPENNIDPGQLVSSCKSCLAALQAGDSVIPRLEVMENCALALLNLREWDTLTAMDKRWTYLELAAAIAYACQDINKHKGTKKISRDAWDLILPVFGPGVPAKRTSSGATVSPTGSNLTKNCLVNFLVKLRESTCLTVVISLLARLHNVLKDESALEISCQYIGLWPAVVSNSNSYSSRSVAEVLTHVTLQALKFMPNHYPFLKVLGDINFVMNDWSSALRYYVEAGAVASDYFTQPVPKSAIDHFVYRRMIKCCSQLQCHTQAAVLCQFLDEVDYTTAFKCLSETKSSQCADAMDAYYPCIWDLTILEFLVNMHNKRGETQRKQQVIKMMGLLELNGNNNEEIQREAANIRKRQFLRALTSQYSISSNINNFFVKN